jgi:hypothetical protein
MDPAGQFVFFLLALIALIAAALWASPAPSEGPRWRLGFTPLGLVAIGLALIDFVWMWTAYKAM